jgi:hypothetical protein
MAKRKAASPLKQYNATIAAIKKSTGVSQKEAQQAYRSAKVRLGHAPTVKDAKSKAVKEEAAAAPRRIAAARRAKERAVEASIERAKAPRPKRGAAAPASRRGGRGGAPGGGGGGSGGRGGGREVEFDLDDLERFDEIEGEEGDY